ncbi:MAG: PLDc N-terminal domain-containing protein [Arcticibacter sp.]
MASFIFLVCVMPIIVLDIWAVLDISRVSYKKRREKWLWTNVVLVFPLFGVFFYLFYGRRKLIDG